MAPAPEAVVHLSNVTVDRGPVRALTDVSLDIAAGSLVAVIGPNGAGKSTLFGLITGRLRPKHGVVRVMGDVAVVLQSTTIDPDLRLTVNEVVSMGRYRRRGFVQPFRRRDRELVATALDRVGLSALRHRSIDTLSGGQRQRALLAQGLVQGSPIVLLDEPTTGLDIPSTRRVHEIVDSMRASGRTVLNATHDLDEAAGADLVIALAGRCVCCAPPEVALNDPAVADLFAAPDLRRPAAAARPLA